VTVTTLNCPCPELHISAQLAQRNCRQIRGQPKKEGERKVETASATARQLDQSRLRGNMKKRRYPVKHNGEILG
jgi:hypothetical protein